VRWSGWVDVDPSTAGYSAATRTPIGVVVVVTSDSELSEIGVVVVVTGDSEASEIGVVVVVTGDSELSEVASPHPATTSCIAAATTTPRHKRRPTAPSISRA
jgi:hypothetical protein